MEPEARRRQVKPNAGLLLGTTLVLIVIFIAIIGLFFVLSSFTPSLLGQCVAVVDVDMPLSIEGAPPSLFDEGYAGSEELAATVESLEDRADVGAAVFVFNSPGGSVVATREVYASVKNLSKPKVSYFREVAASGAYYVATGTDYIISDPDAITGSIGVIATFTEMSGLLEKIGVNVTEVKSGPHKDIGSSFRNMTAEERTILQAMIDEIYLEFRGVVIENRGGRLNREIFENVTDGRIMSGRQAYRAGLVDEIGTKKDAIMKAADLAGIPYSDYEDIRVCPVTVSYPQPGLFGMEGLLRGFEARSGVPSISYK